MPQARAIVIYPVTDADDATATAQAFTLSDSAQIILIELLPDQVQAPGLYPMTYDTEGQYASTPAPQK